jgi:hypothetical protein
LKRISNEIFDDRCKLQRTVKQIHSGSITLNLLVHIPHTISKTSSCDYVIGSTQLEMVEITNKQEGNENAVPLAPCTAPKHNLPLLAAAAFYSLFCVLLCEDSQARQSDQNVVALSRMSDVAQFVESESSGKWKWFVVRNPESFLAAMSHSCHL